MAAARASARACARRPLHARPVADAGRAPRPAPPGGRRHRPVGRDELDHLAQVGAAAGRRPCCRGRGSRPGRASALYCTEPCASSSPTRRRTRRGTTTSSPRRWPGRARRSRSRPRASASPTLPPPRGYRRIERFYPLSSRLFQRSRARLPLKARRARGGGRRRSSRARADVLHVQWLALPQADALLRFRSPSVFTAHDLLPRRTAEKRDLWQRLLARFDRVVVHTTAGASTLRELGVEARVISHPGLPERRRPRRRRPDAARARRDPAVQGPRRTRSRSCGGWRMRGCSSRATRRCRSTGCATRRGPSGGSATCRRPRSTARSRTRRVAIFPYRAGARPVRRDAPGARRGRARRSPTTSAGSPSRSRASAPAASCPAGDVEALTEAARELLADPAALAAARAGAERARAELTWDAAAATHLELYRELA